MSSAAQVAANQANAQLSTGPKTAEGKAKSSRNALKTGLTGLTILVPAEQAELYETHLLAWATRFNPVGDIETQMVQSIADTWWRLESIPSLEASLFARGRLEFCELFPEQEASQRASLIQAETMFRYHRHFSSLYRQEQRLMRNAQKLSKDLEAMQAERKQHTEETYIIAAKMYLAAKQDNKPFDPAEFGFELSIEDIKGFIQAMQTRRHAEKIRLAA